MKIGIDLDGTAWKYRALFIDIIKGLQLLGHTVGIITAHIGLREKDLKLFAARGFPKPDFYLSKITGEENIPTRTWKLARMKEHGIDFIFDDFDTDEISLIGR